jgi:NAD(P)-dependent dehydrogenase (short-subunit alcohol dehydrogenase family)
MLVAGMAQRHGRLDGAFNNAGIEGPTAKLLKLSVEEWERVIRVDLTGVFVCMKCEIEQMARQHSGGSIISTASVAGVVGIPGAAGYITAKHGVVGLTKCVALEYAAGRTRVNAVFLGFINTPMLAAHHRRQPQAARADRQRGADAPHRRARRNRRGGGLAAVRAFELRHRRRSAG